MARSCGDGYPRADGLKVGRNRLRDGTVSACAALRRAGCATAIKTRIAVVGYWPLSIVPGRTIVPTFPRRSHQGI
jgi:hypothetical protein